MYSPLNKINQYSINHKYSTTTPLKYLALISGALVPHASVINIRSPFESAMPRDSVSTNS